MTQSKYAPTMLPGGPQKIIQICEDLRVRNKDGYMPGNSCRFLANVKGSTVPVGPGTTCSPFTGCAIGVAFDPKYPKDDLNGAPYEPLFNGGNDPLPFHDFYHEHNNVNDHGVLSVVDYGLGREIKAKEMRRGDLVELNWVGHGGHMVFCWDVHLDEKGDVDCFLIIGANGPSPGLSIYGCRDKRWIKGSNGTPGKVGSGSQEKAKDKIFADDDDDIIKAGMWMGLPGAGKIDKSTFRVRPSLVFPAGPEWTVNTIRVARFNYEGDPPAPVCMKPGTVVNKSQSGAGATPPPPPPATTAQPPGHLDAPATTIKGNDLKKDPAAAQKVPPTKGKQDAAKPLDWQHEVEHAMQELFHAGWLKSDPGSSEDINDAKTQAAIKEFQKTFKLDVDGIVGPMTKAELRKQLPACRLQHVAQEQLAQLFKGGKLKCDPGPPGADAEKMHDAVSDFQQGNGLSPTGLPDAATQEKLKQVLADAAPSSSQHGLSPAALLLYWLGNQVAPGGTATLRLHTLDVKVGQEFQMLLKDLITGKEVDAGVKLVVSGPQSQAAIPMPADFAAGCCVVPRVKASGTPALELAGFVPVYVGTPPAVQKAQAGELQPFFKFQGDVGEGSRKRDYTYVAYKVAGKTSAWCIKGRLMMDADGAPNCYHPSDYNVSTHYAAIDLLGHQGALDWKKNGGHPGNWFGVVTDTGEVTGTPIIQGPNDPFPGFYVAASSLVDKSKGRNDPHRYVDARKIPYLAWPGQVWREAGPRFTRVTQGPTGRIGDYITAVNPKNNQVAHCILADMGGGDDPHFGEGSPALGKLLDAYGLAEPDIFYLVYPHSGANQGTIPSAEEVQQNGEKLFSDWGGLQEATRVLSLMPK